MFYLEVLGPLGLEEDLPSYRRTEEIVYLRFGEQNLGLRPPTGRAEYYGSASSTAFEVATEQVDLAERCLALGAEIHSRRRRTATSRTTTRSSSSTRTGSGSKSSGRSRAAREPLETKEP